ncbi:MULTISPECIES: heme biosynthesis HemY N-terminal domain-containing protein [Shewanella]|uniref:heme biosynthesis HemY N-terminal domain-containing protein n=1 Tax=Shewanella TaxID=22 RepID=UPI000C5C59AC|nr:MULTISPECIES: heme biosynthesis HemY N-terminal domain-containing protein [Shewanella]NCQ46887.1 heme biosynthesis protein HemY [Shewanella frigidimarina]NCO73211.1 heme biosynthesis protein HemY [Shewanella vesiculosa]NCP38258.1 heme biosynthesis protein HemY [Shewanella vesiculosa]NCP71635.1 heme biosynthesis protein HemY [Shewanella vesiculosa]NCP75991.1 heme biosynthesis protein HemY [Shewanella vesiculosa]
MIKTLVYVVLILIGLCLSPLIVGQSGYVYIAIGDYQIETSLVIGVVGLIVFYFALQLLEWLILLLLNMLLSSRYLPEQWRRKAAKKHTLTGALALAEEDWPAAEKAMAKGAEKGEIPVLNLFAAARAAHYQGDITARDHYLTQAENNPIAKTAVYTSRTRYLMKQGELTQARVVLDKLNPTSKSSAPVLKLAQELYLQQNDWQALKLLLPILKKRQLLSETEFNQLNTKTNSILMVNAAKTSEAELNKCWHWLSKSERKQDELVVAYAHGLTQYGHKDKAIKLIIKQLSAAPSAALFAAIPDLIDAQDQEVRKLLSRLETTHENDADYQMCLAKLAIQSRDTKQAKTHWQNVCRMAPTHQSWLALAQAQEQLGENSSAANSYRNAANII